MNFDTFKTTLAEFSWFSVCPFPFMIGIDTGDNVKVGFGRGLAFATSFSVPPFSTLAIGISSDVSVTLVSLLAT